MTRIRLIAFLICCLGGPLVNAWLTDGSSSSHVFAAEDSLKSVVAGRFDVGVGAGLRALRDPNNQDLVVRHFNYLTPENCMKFASVQPNEGEFLFQKADRMVEFAQANNLKVLGHCLVWAKDDRTPQWFYRNGDQEVSPELLMKRMKRHIKTVVERYKGRVQSWDVVNEAIGGRQDEYLRDSVWAKLLNDHFIVEAFKYTHQLDPSATLIYNDYHLHEKWRRDRMVRLVNKLRSENAPIDAIGIQGHYNLDQVPFKELEQLLLLLRKLKLKIAISELDIDMIPRGIWWANGGRDRDTIKSYNPYMDGCPEELLERQAQQYAQLFDLFQKYEDVILRISFWNIHDGESWLNDFPWKRKNYPTLFDRDRRPKPAFSAVINSLRKGAIASGFRKNTSKANGSKSDSQLPESTPSDVAKQKPLKVQSKTKPNILFIAVDDLRPELNCYGVNGPITPNFDRLAKTGTRFDRAYCQQAVCGASRLSIMGGLYPTLTREQTFHVSGWRKRHPSLTTMNQHFRANGFETIGLGKIYHGTSGAGVDPDNWDRWVKLKGKMYTRPENLAAAKAYQDNPDGNLRGPFYEIAETNPNSLNDGTRATMATDLLEQLSQDDKPFFLAVGFTKPHLPFVAPKKYWDLYKPEQFSMPTNKGIPPGYPFYAANLKAHELMKYNGINGTPPTEFTTEMNQRMLHGYAACTSYVDACLGKLLDALDKNGLADNTIVVLWGDHGWKLGDHSSWVKHTNLECDTRVPLLMRVPDKQNGKPMGQLVELIDLYPTLCDLTGIETPKHCQGKSFAKLFDSSGTTHRRSAYSSYPARKELGHSIRFDAYRYTEWRTKSGETTAAVLTDLEADPGEVTNVIDDPRHAEALATAKKRLAQRIVESLDKRTGSAN